ncbi:MAG: ankyrin repeat domain-containing protein [Verrucomicrobium sp.]|nr:ankyrin repeat domain-containing protein [Verrucomicrobium sp.]
MEPSDSKFTPPADVAAALDLRHAIQEGSVSHFFRHRRLSLAHFLTDTPSGTPLTKAAECGWLTTVATHLRKNGETLSLDHLMAKDHLGNTALQLAADKGNLNQVASLLQASDETLTLSHVLADHGADNTLLHWATNKRQLDRIAALLKKSGQVLELDHFLRPNQFGQTALHWAASRGCLDQVEEIVRPAGKTPFTSALLLLPDKQGATPLERAVLSEHLDRVFVPARWAGRAPEMLALWNHVPEAKRGQIPFQEWLHETLLLKRTLPLLEKDSFRTAARPSSPLPVQDSPRRERSS